MTAGLLSARMGCRIERRTRKQAGRMPLTEFTHKTILDISGEGDHNRSICPRLIELAQQLFFAGVESGVKPASIWSHMRQRVEDHDSEESSSSSHTGWKRSRDWQS